MRSWCGMWAKRNGCGCFLGLSSFLGALVLLLELVLAILTLTVRAKVLQMLCEKVVCKNKEQADCKWDPPVGSDDGHCKSDDGLFEAGSTGGGTPSGSETLNKILEDYQHYSNIIAYVLFGLAFLQLVRFLMGRYVSEDESELEEQLRQQQNRQRTSERVSEIRQRNRYMRQQEAAMMEGRPLDGPGDGSGGDIQVEEPSKCAVM